MFKRKNIPTFTKDEICTMIILASTIDPEQYNNPAVAAAIYKAKSIVEVDGIVRRVPEFYVSN